MIFDIEIDNDENGIIKLMKSLTSEIVERLKIIPNNNYYNILQDI